MKKVLLGVLLLGVFGFAEAPKYVSATNISGYVAGENFIHYEINGESLPTGNANFLEVTFERVLDWDGIHIPAVTTDGDDITSGVISFLKADNSVISTASIIVGTAFIDVIESQRIRVKLENPSANAITVVTADILAWND